MLLPVGLGSARRLGVAVRKELPHVIFRAKRFIAGTTVQAVGGGRIRETPLGRFSFRYLKPQLRGGYRLIDLGGGQRAFVASPEKAFLDLVHLQPGGDDPARIDGLRLNLETLSVRRLVRIATATGRPKLKRAAAHLARLASDPALAYEPL